jgi:hypothetical protein
VHGVFWFSFRRPEQAGVTAAGETLVAEERYPNGSFGNREMPYGPK